jgi:hypothetical protein
MKVTTFQLNYKSSLLQHAIIQALLSLSPNQFSWRDEEGLAVLTDALISADERFLGWALFVAHALGLDGGRRGRRL